METLITILIVIAAVIQLIAIIVFFVMANNISAIRKLITPKDREFRAKFYSFILAGEKDRARLLLFESISKDEEFILAAHYRSKRTLESAQTTLNEKYKYELKFLGMDDLDLSSIQFQKEENK